MATAKQLPSGSWRIRVYSHTEKVYDKNSKTYIDKKVYRSFTSTDSSKRGKNEAEAAAAAFLAENNERQRRNIHSVSNMTLGNAIDKYIAYCEDMGRSATTVQGYRVIRRNAFPNLMNVKLKDLDEDLINDAIIDEQVRTHNRWEGNTKPVSAKCIRNEWGLVSSVLHRYWPHINFYLIDLPKVNERTVELPSAKAVFNLVKGSSIELPVLLAMWLSFSLSEVRGLTRSGSISQDGNYITINQVVVDVNGKPVVKSEAKNDARKRRHRIPAYIQGLIDQLPDDQDALVSISGQALSGRWNAMQKKAGWDPVITFHDLRHMSASIMALLRIPDKYAQERGGWKTDRVMKKVYMNTFSEERVRVDDLIDDYFDEIL